MRIGSHFHKAIGAALFAVVTLLMSIHTVSAQEQTALPADGVYDEPILSETAPPYTVTPVVANEKAKPRDIIKKELVLTNNTAQKTTLYITVEDIDPLRGAEAYEGVSNSDLATSLASWVEITRGVIELDSGESRKIPYLIHVNLTARPGSYFVHIKAREGSNRTEAEARDDGATLMLNVEVLDDAKERLQLGTFATDDSVILGTQVSFSYLLENIGNRDIEPRGSIRIFNRRGEEVGSVPLNPDGLEILPENKEQLAAAWSAAGRFGKYKAFLDLEYGENQLASVQDTVYFWVFPWKEILATLVGILVLAVVGTFIIHMRAVARPRPVYQEHRPTPASPAPSPLTRTGRFPAHMRDPKPSRAFASPGTINMSSRGPARQGNTVSLAPREHGHGTSTRGNTVTLAPRR